MPMKNADKESLTFQITSDCLMQLCIMPIMYHVKLALLPDVHSLLVVTKPGLHLSVQFDRFLL